MDLGDYVAANTGGRRNSALSKIFATLPDCSQISGRARIVGTRGLERTRILPSGADAAYRIEKSGDAIFRKAPEKAGRIKRASGNRTLHLRCHCQYCVRRAGGRRGRQRSTYYGTARRKSFWGQRGLADSRTTGQPRKSRRFQSSPDGSGRYGVHSGATQMSALSRDRPMRRTWISSENHKSNPAEANSLVRARFA